MGDLTIDQQVVAIDYRALNRSRDLAEDEMQR